MIEYGFHPPPSTRTRLAAPPNTVEGGCATFAIHLADSVAATQIIDAM